MLIRDINKFSNNVTTQQRSFTMAPRRRAPQPGARWRRVRNPFRARGIDVPGWR
jgi:hypothetical protein